MRISREKEVREAIPPFLLHWSKYGPTRKPNFCEMPYNAFGVPEEDSMNLELVEKKAESRVKLPVLVKEAYGKWVSQFEAGFISKETPQISKNLYKY